jgi:hypothetical protein
MGVPVGRSSGYGGRLAVESARIRRGEIERREGLPHEEAPSAAGNEDGRAGTSRPPDRQHPLNDDVSPSDPFPLGLARTVPGSQAVEIKAPEPTNPPKVSADRNTRPELGDTRILVHITS